MTWFFIALGAPFLWSITNHLEKYLIEKYFKTKGTGSIVVFSSVIGIIILPIFLLINPDILSIKPLYALIIVLGGAIGILGLLPYYYALKRDEASYVVPLFQTVPIFSFFLGYFFLKETVSGQQILAAVLIIAGAVGLSLNFSRRKAKLKKEVLFLMLAASFLAALNTLIFKFVAIDEDFWITVFWEFSGAIIFSVLLLIFIGSYRKQFVYIFKNNKASILSLTVLNEILSTGAELVLFYAALLAPIGLVWAVNGFQPFFVLVIGLILTLFFPKIAKENIEKNHLIQKIAAIAVMFVGSYFLNQ